MRCFSPFSTKLACCVSCALQPHNYLPFSLLRRLNQADFCYIAASQGHLWSPPARSDFTVLLYLLPLILVPMASHLIWLLLCFISSLICGVAAILFHLKPRRTSSSSSSTATRPPDSAPPPSSSVGHPKIKYDVFLSFRGTDTRSGFLSHLLEELKREKIDYFVDDQMLRQGDEISPTLLSAIKKSQISVVVFSKDYADSKWCLEELEQIIRCRENQKQIILPVFYQVDPSTVRHQKGSYKNALDKLGKRFGKHELQKWQISLKKAADLSGFVSSKYPTEAILIKEIVERVSEELRKMENEIDLEGFVGIQNHIEDLERLLHMESQDILIIGIWGMGGVGKTTIAEILYNRLQLHNKYDGKHFLCVKEGLEIHRGKEQLRRYLLSKLLLEKKEDFDDVTLHGIPTWVKRRLNQKKIPVVLDSINESDQLEILTGGHEWFGSGSRIIMTSRDKHLFSSKCDEIFEVKPLNPKDAAKLFEKKLTEKCHVRKQERYELSEKVLNYAQGVPLAIEVLAHFLYDKNKDEWKSKLEKLEKMPDSNIQNILELSYHGLEDCEHKEIFLYLACFFRYESKEQITMLLDAIGYHTTDRLRVLQDKALITFYKISGSLHMHDLIRVMGCKIVRQLSPKNLGLRTHLWDRDDICKAFKNEMGTTKIESIRLNGLRLRENLQLGSQAFVGINNLKLLQFDHKVYPPDEGFEWLSNELRLFNWIGYPSKSFPSRLCPENLVELDFFFSKLERLWDGVQDFPNLKVINLAHSYELTEVPDLSKAPNLEVITLAFSYELTEVPDLSKAPNLKKIHLWHCGKLRCFGLWPNHNMVELDSTAYEERKKISIEESKEDDRLDLCGTSLPIKPSYKYYVFSSLQFLHLGGCTSLVELPDKIDLCFPSLQTLYLHNTNVKIIPTSIKHLSRLTFLQISGCSQLQYIPELPPTVECLAAFGCRSLETIQFTSNSMPLSHKPSYKYYVFSSLRFLDLSGCTSLVELPDKIDLCFPSLQTLNLSNTNVKIIPTSIKHLSRLTCLDIHRCSQLQYIPELPPTVEELVVFGCRSLEMIQFTSNSMPFSRKHGLYIDLSGCVKLDDHTLRAIAWYFKFTIQRMISASMKDGYGYLHFPTGEIPKWFNDRYYRVTQDSRSHALVLPLHSEVMGFICFFALLGKRNVRSYKLVTMKCHIAYLSDIELRNNVPVLKGHIQFTYCPRYLEVEVSDRVSFCYESSLDLKITEDLSRIKASAGTTDDLCALVWFELENKSKFRIKEWGVYCNCAMDFHDMRFLWC